LIKGNMKYIWRSIVVPRLAMVLTALLVACSGTVTPPAISDLQPALALNGKTGITTLAEFSFKNSGGSDLVYTLSENADWLSITDGSSATVKPNTNQTIKLSATCPTPKPSTTLVEKVKLSVSGFTSLNSEITVTLTCTDPNTKPNPFGFGAVFAADLNTDVTSEKVTISGIEAPTLVTTDNGVVLINDVVFSPITTQPITIKNGDKLQSRIKSSSLFGTTTSANVTVGGVSAVFSVTTKLEPKLSVSVNPNNLSIKLGESKTSEVTIKAENLVGDTTITVTPINGISADSVVIPASSSSRMAILTVKVASNATTGQFNLPVVASSGGITATTSIAVTIIGTSPTTVSISGYQAIIGLVNKMIASQTPTIMGGTTPYTVSIDSPLPAGLNFDSVTGTISGTPTIASTLKTYTITVMDSSTPVQSATTTVTVNINPTLNIKTVYNNINGTIGFDLKNPGVVVVEGGTPPYSYSIAPTLPAGLILDANNGKITGKPTVLYPQTSHTVTIKDADGTIITTIAKVSVSQVPSFTKGYQSLINEVTDPEKLPQTPEFTGGAQPVVFSISPNLTEKTGILLDTATGTISGAPTKVVLEEKYTVTITDANGASSMTTFRVLILPRFAPKVALVSIKSNENIKTDLKTIKIGFNKNVNVTADGMTLVCNNQNIAFTGLPINKNSEVTLTLLSELPANAVCTLTIFKNKVADTLNPPLNMEADFVVSFNTDAAPVVVSSNPPKQVIPILVATDQAITVTFSEPVDVTASGITVDCPVGSPQTILGLPASNSSSVTIRPSTAWPQDTVCTVTVHPAGVTDSDVLDAPDQLAAPYTFQFKTDAAPVVVSSDPGNGSTILPNKPLVITFSEAVAISNSGLVIICNNLPFTTFSSTLQIPANTNLTITPNIRWPENANCSLTIAATAVSDLDLLDPPNLMVDNYILNFKTADTIALYPGCFVGSPRFIQPQALGHGQPTQYPALYPVKTQRASPDGGYTSTIAATKATISAQAMITLAATPTTIYVDASFVGIADGTQAKPFPTVQAAVNAASAGDSLQVAAGTYSEQVVINKNLAIIGAGKNNTIIKAPVVMVLDSEAANSSYSIVKIKNAANVTMRDIQVAGPGPGGCGTLHSGIFIIENAVLAISDAKIQSIRDNPFSGCQNGIGIRAGRQFYGLVGSVFVSNVEFIDYQKGGIVVDNIGSYGDIRNSSFVGNGPTTVTAQNGIQISRGATGIVLENTIIGHNYTPNTFSAAGIILFQAGDGVKILGNTLIDNQIGLSVYESNNVIASGNSFSGGTDAVANERANNPDPQVLDFCNNTFDGIPAGTASDAELATIEDRIVHRMDDASYGLVVFRTNTDIVVATINNLGLQTAIDLAQPGYKIIVGPGTFTLTAPINVNKAVNITGLGEAVTIFNFNNTIENKINVSANGATMRKLRLGSSVSGVGIQSFALLNVSASDTNFSNITFAGPTNTRPGLFTTLLGVFYQASATNSSLTDSIFIGLGSNGYTAPGSSGIFSNNNSNLSRSIYFDNATPWSITNNGPVPVNAGDTNRFWLSVGPNTSSLTPDTLAYVAANNNAYVFDYRIDPNNKFVAGAAGSDVFSPTTGRGNTYAPYASIQKGVLDVASNGKVYVIVPGIYTMNANLALPGKVVGVENISGGAVTFNKSGFDFTGATVTYSGITVNP
jgi:parallel beta-helix repeat protein